MLIEISGWLRPTSMWLVMIRWRSSIGSRYHSRFFSKGYTNMYFRSETAISGRTDSSE